MNEQRTKLENQVQKHPDSWLAQVRLADFFYTNGNLHKALQHYEVAARLKPEILYTYGERIERSLKLLERENDAKIFLQSLPEMPQAAAMNTIWKQLHFKKPIDLPATQINRKTATIHFAQTANYEYIRLHQLKDKIGFNFEAYRQSGTKERRHRKRIEAATAYHEMVARNGCMEIISPLTGNKLESRHSWQTHTKFKFYRFEEAEIFYLIVGDFWDEKAAFYFPERELIVELFRVVGNLRHALTDFKGFLVSGAQKVKKQLASQPTEKAIIIGDPHFAHHLWNELTGLESMLDNGTLQQVDRIYVLHETLGKIDQLFPEIPAAKIRRISKARLEQSLLDEQLFLLPMGGCFIKTKTSHRVIKIAGASVPSFVKIRIKEAQKKHPLLWVSIRTGSRTWRNQVQALRQIIAELYQQYPKLGLVFDGYSRTSGSEAINYNLERIIEAEQKIVRQILEAFPKTILVQNNIGKPIGESMLWAQAIDFYLAHQGSLQHKVAWLSQKSGIVHTNRFILNNIPQNLRPGNWEREDMTLPYYLPVRLVNNAHEKVFIRGIWAKHGKVLNYTCSWRGVWKQLKKRCEACLE